MKRLLNIIFLIFSLATAGAATYVGRVLDSNGAPVSYATVYPEEDPILGTATNDDGLFVLETSLPPASPLIISFIGYQKQTLPLAAFASDRGDTASVTLYEQPIALEETVIQAKTTKRKNKRKQMAYLLHQVYTQMEADFSDDPTAYRIVSDIRMDSEGEAWGMEQMIARVVNLPELRKDGRDSVQFAGEYCKRYFKQDIRALADSIYSHDKLDKDVRRMAVAVDSGIAAHKGLWAAGNIRYDFQNTADEIKRWTVAVENDGETVLTHTEKKDFLGIFKMVFARHYILDSETLSVRRFSEQAEFWVNIPFGYRLRGEQLQLLNLLNMGEQEIEKFRLRKVHAVIRLNTIYQRRDGHIYTLEKNLETDALITGSKKMEIPVRLRATQRVTQIDTQDVRPMTRRQMTNRVKRHIVPIY